MCVEIFTNYVSVKVKTFLHPLPPPPSSLPLSPSLSTDFEQRFPPSEVGDQRSSHSSLLNGALPPLDIPSHDEDEFSEDPILPPPAAFLGSERRGSTTYIGEVEATAIQSPSHRARGSEKKREVSHWLAGMLMCTSGAITVTSE